MDRRNPAESGPLRFAAGIALAAVGGVIAGAGMVAARRIEGPGGDLLLAGAVAVSMALIFAAGVWWWARLDEAAREAHKWAWWWGGTGGLLLAAIPLLNGMASGRLRDGDMVDGLMTVMFCQTACYALAWGYWWLRRR